MTRILNLHWCCVHMTVTSPPEFNGLNEQLKCFRQPAMDICGVSQQLQLAVCSSEWPMHSRVWPTGAAAFYSSGSAPQLALFYCAIRAKQPTSFWDAINTVIIKWHFFSYWFSPLPEIIGSWGYSLKAIQPFKRVFWCLCQKSALDWGYQCFVNEICWNYITLWID